MRPTFLARAVIAGASMGAAMLVPSEPAGAGDCTFPLVIVGRIDKASAKCDKDVCLVRVALERRMYQRGASVSGDILDVGLWSRGEAIDRRSGARWPSPRDALVHLADQDRVMIAGIEDSCASFSFTDSNKARPKVVLHASMLTRLGAARPAVAARDKMVFPPCETPSRTPEEAARCEAARSTKRAVTVTATVLGPAAGTSGDRFTRAWLPIEIVSVRDGVELVPPSFEDMATIMATAKVIGATAERPRVTSLQAGDTVLLEGSYQDSSMGHVLVIDRSITLPAPARARRQP